MIRTHLLELLYISYKYICLNYRWRTKWSFYCCEEAWKGWQGWEMGISETIGSPYSLQKVQMHYFFQGEDLQGRGWQGEVKKRVHEITKIQKKHPNLIFNCVGKYGAGMKDNRENRKEPMRIGTWDGKMLWHPCYCLNVEPRKSQVNKHRPQIR